MSIPPNTIPVNTIPLNTNLSTLPRGLIRQYHPVLQSQWKQQITAYQTNPPMNPDQFQEGFAWEDPYRYFRFWTIVDFLRDFSLTR